ncbi:response regulator [uncultured Ramlibacter sp.]|uniref:response regulator n=1 Tax=uncultured Ramlibacter sp. TaxID=260755 RepID=UPI002626639C|nr:response regulator [uncultured Ramlibacter sp.]
MTLKAYVVEDSPAIRSSLVESLEELAGIVTTGVSGQEQQAIAWLGDPANAWDIAIVDLLLESGGNGLRVLAALRGRSSQQKVVVLTGMASAEVRRQCETLGCDAIFDKAMEAEALLDFCAALSREAATAAQPRA